MIPLSISGTLSTRLLAATPSELNLLGARSRGACRRPARPTFSVTLASTCGARRCHHNCYFFETQQTPYQYTLLEFRQFCRSYQKISLQDGSSVTSHVQKVERLLKNMKAKGVEFFRLKQYCDSADFLILKSSCEIRSRGIRAAGGWANGIGGSSLQRQRAEKATD
ncbi:hypothetical protein DFS34DRAFT_332178 [Phlyctochytrium arcticum]|nr:hypothetical protein DFS34DRAFT_332178 [Phlyctochytrium arcticum]